MSRCDAGRVSAHGAGQGRSVRPAPGRPWRAALAGLALALLAATASADERILHYHADINVGRDAGVTVTETIRVRSEGREIRRGIYRDFPTDYKDRHGNRVRVEFRVLDVTRNGAGEAWHTEGRGNGVRVYAGSANRFVDPGVHEYRIRYHTNRQLGFFEDFDELYWNVTGLGWAFPIDQASATVHLPEAVPEDALRLAVYTGSRGSRASNAGIQVRNDGSVAFLTTEPLGPYQGLTIAVGWPKGVVVAPTATQEAGWFLRDNAGALVLLLAFAGMLAWYFWAWHRKGRDPAKGVIIPRYEPPKGLSPAACRFVKSMGFGRQAFTAAVVSLGVKGHLDIDEDDGEFTLRANRDTKRKRQATSPGEQAVLDALLPDLGRGSIKLEQSNHARFQAARQGISRALKGEYQGRLFNLNVMYALPPIIVFVLATALAAILGQKNPLIWAAWGILGVGLHVLFIFLLRAPTPGGRKVMDEIEGFALYLGTAEQDRLDRMQGPKLTPEVFEAFLPYAFALGVENRWVDRFQQAFPEHDPDRGGYRPAWYHGNLHGAHALGHIGSGLSSGLSSAISSASSPPGSSSGSGGGGFSGGGGGGGGGGGW